MNERTSSNFWIVQDAPGKPWRVEERKYHPNVLSYFIAPSHTITDAKKRARQANLNMKANQAATAARKAARLASKAAR